MTNAEMKPANSITSATTASAIPKRALSVRPPRRTGRVRIRSVILGSMVVLVRHCVLSGRGQGVESGILLPVPAAVLHHIGRKAREQQHHQHQNDGEQPVDDGLLDV